MVEEVQKKPRKKRVIANKNERRELALNRGWFSRLKDDELGKDEETGEEFVYFKGLSRLVEEAGKVSEEITHFHTDILTNPHNNQYNIVCQIIVKVTFNDGTSWTGAADAHIANCRKYKVHPTAMAETRALARAYRRALGIYTVSYEETASEEDEGLMTDQITGPQVKLIETQLKKNKLNLIDIISKVTDREIYKVEDLSYKEAQVLIKVLNDEIIPKKVKDEAKK